MHHSSPDTFRKEAEDLGIEFIEVSVATRLFDNVYLTSPIERKFDEKNYVKSNFVEIDGKKEVDKVHDSMAFGILIDQGWVLLTRCGHAGIMNMSFALRTLQDAPVHSVVGGLHLFNAKEEVIETAAQSMKQHGIKKLIGAHCTGTHATAKIASVANLSRQDVSNGAIGTRLEGDLTIKRAPGPSTE